MKSGGDIEGKGFRRLKGYSIIPNLLPGRVFEDGVEKRQKSREDSKTNAECAA